MTWPFLDGWCTDIISPDWSTRAVTLRDNTILLIIICRWPAVKQEVPSHCVGPNQVSSVPLLGDDPPFEKHCSRSLHLLITDGWMYFWQNVVHAFSVVMWETVFERRGWCVCVSEGVCVWVYDYHLQSCVCCTQWHSTSIYECILN